MKSQYQSMEKVAIAEAQNYGLTVCETDVWLRHRANYTYKEIAVELKLTPNRVKKHLQSIRLKQKVALGMEE